MCPRPHWLICNFQEISCEAHCLSNLQHSLHLAICRWTPTCSMAPCLITLASCNPCEHWTCRTTPFGVSFLVFCVPSRCLGTLTQRAIGSPDHCRRSGATAPVLMYVLTPLGQVVHHDESRETGPTSSLSQHPSSNYLHANLCLSRVHLM